MSEIKIKGAANQIIDATGLACPLPLLKLKLSLKSLNTGDILELITTDAGSKKDVPIFCDLSEHELIEQSEKNEIYHFWVKHG